MVGEGGGLRFGVSNVTFIYVPVGTVRNYRYNCVEFLQIEKMPVAPKNSNAGPC